MSNASDQFNSRPRILLSFKPNCFWKLLFLEEEGNGCPDTHPHVYGYNYEGEFCCSHEPYDGPNGDYCMDDPVLDHPDFVKPEKGQLIVEEKKNKKLLGSW